MNSKWSDADVSGDEFDIEWNRTRNAVRAFLMISVVVVTLLLLALSVGMVSYANESLVLRGTAQRISELWLGAIGAGVVSTVALGTIQKCFGEGSFERRETTEDDGADHVVGVSS